MRMKKISVDRSSFEELRGMDCIYVDKTEYVYTLVKDMSSSYYFISRPRRYGKSLMCSTLHCLFDGKRELFKDLYIDRTDYSFERFPVLHFNFAKVNSGATISYEKFLKSFQDAVSREARNNGITVEREEPCDMLLSIMDQLDKKVVIIVDEYDTPILHTYRNIDVADRIRDCLSSFYSVIKNTSEKVRFFFLTGITKFSNMSIFSQMNNLKDLTFHKDYASAFGYTEDELESNFSEYIDAYMTKDDREYETREDFLSAVRDYYDGYRFSYKTPVKVYNPVSVGFFFDGDCSFQNYWIGTGASTLAVDLAKDYHLGKIITDDMKIGLDTMSTFDYSLLASKRLNSSQVLALIYFTGYLTIKEGNTRSLTLTFPNNEVRLSFTQSLMELYSGLDVGVYLDDAYTAVAGNDINRLVKIMNAYYEKIPYTILAEEIGYQSMFYAFFLLMGVDSIIVEETTTLGRIDVLITTENEAWVIEIKVDQSALAALKQIKEKRYYGKIINTEKTIHIIGLDFSSKTRQITDWKEEVIYKTKEPAYLG